MSANGVTLFLALLVIGVGLLLQAALLVPHWGRWLLGNAWPGNRDDTQRRAMYARWYGVAAACGVGGLLIALDVFAPHLPQAIVVARVLLWGLWIVCGFVSVDGLRLLRRK